MADVDFPLELHSGASDDAGIVGREIAGGKPAIDHRVVHPGIDVEMLIELVVDNERTVIHGAGEVCLLPTLKASEQDSIL